jgi:hypothetical protein
MLQEKVGYPYTMLPDDLFNHAAGGYGGQGSLCGSLGACAALINLIAFDKDKSHTKLTADLLKWYSQTEMPSNRCDAIATHKDQYKEAPGSTLCHVSVSSWILKANTNYDAPARKDRCGKVTGDAVYQTVLMLNDYSDGKYTAVKAKLSAETAGCMSCHGKGGDNNVTIQQDCMDCHTDHTK